MRKLQYFLFVLKRSYIYYEVSNLHDCTLNGNAQIIWVLLYLPIGNYRTMIVSVPN